MRVLSQFIVRVFDLIEAEGDALLTTVREEARRVRSAAAQMALGLTLLVVAVPMLMTGFGFLTVGLLWLLESHLSRWLAACLTGASVLIVGVLLILGFARLAWRRKS